MPLAAFPKCFLDDLCVHRTMSVDAWIDMSMEFDVDGIEFYWGFTPQDNPAEWERIRKRMESLGRSIPMMCYSSDFTKPTIEERKVEIEGQKKAIRACVGLGIQYCRILSGQRRPDLDHATGLRWVHDCITELIPYAEENRIELIIENHYKDGYWEFPEFAQKMDVFLELVNSIPNSRWFGVNYDPSNAIIAGDDPIELLENVKHRVKTMHASDRYFEGGTLDDLRLVEANPHTGYASILKHGIIGQGLNNYDRILSTLKGAGFKGWISIEDGPDPDTGARDIAESARFLRVKMKEHGIV